MMRSTSEKLLLHRTRQVNCLRAVAGVQFLEDVLDMFVDCWFCNSEFLGYLAVFASHAHQAQDLCFTFGERTWNAGILSRRLVRSFLYNRSWYLLILVHMFLFGQRQQRVVWMDREFEHTKKEGYRIEWVMGTKDRIQYIYCLYTIGYLLNIIPINSYLFMQLAENRVALLKCY